MLAEIPAHIDDQSFNLDSVHRIDIYNRDAIEQFGNYFSNAKEVTLTDEFILPRGTITNDLNRIIPLRQLTRLTLQCRHLFFEKLIELLDYTPHLHTLELYSICIRSKVSTSMQTNDLFQRVSSMNIVTNLTIEKEITLEKLQRLIDLFPRLESLTMNFDERALESIIVFLLPKANKNTCHLSVLCILKRAKTFKEKLHNLIQSENFMENYNLKQISRKVCLWW